MLYLCFDLIKMYNILAHHIQNRQPYILVYQFYFPLCVRMCVVYMCVYNDIQLPVQQYSARIKCLL